MTRQSCHSHCADCGQHFVGIEAFDIHIRNREHLVASVVTSLKDPHKFLLQAWTEQGSCDKEIGCWVNGKRVKRVEPVTIWQKIPSASAREWLYGTADKPRGGANDSH